MKEYRQPAVAGMDAHGIETAQTVCSAMQALPAQEQVARLKGYVEALGGDADLRETGFGLAGAVKCLKARSIVEHGVLETLQAALTNKKNNRLRAAACVAVECLSLVLANVFEPFALKLLRDIMLKIGDKVKEVQAVAEPAFAALMTNLSAHGIYAVMPVFGECLCSRQVGRVNR